MNLSNLKPAEGSVKRDKRIGRGEGSGHGGTSTRGYKGAQSRSGYSKKIGFEGGQMPMHRRLPKFGFTSRIGRRTAEVRLSELAKVDGDMIDMLSLKAANVIDAQALQAKIILSGAVDRAVTVKGLGVTKGAREAIEAAGGKIEE